MATKEVCEVSESDVPENKTQKILNKYQSANGWFWSGLIRYPGLMSISFILSLVNGVLALLPSILIGLGIDVLIREGFGTLFIIIAGSIIGTAVLTWIVSFTSSYLWGTASYRIERDMRQEFFEVIQEHSMAFHDEHDSGKLLSMGMNEIGQIRFAYQPSLRLLFNTGLNIVLTCVYIFIRIPMGQDFIGAGTWVIGTGIVISFIFYFILAWRFAARIGPIRRQLATDLGELSSASQEVFRGIEVVRSFDSEDKEERKFEKLSENYAEVVKKEGYLSAFYWPSLLIVLATGAAFGIGLWLIPQGMLTIGQLATMLTLLIRLLMFNFMIPMRLLMLQAGLVNAKRIWDVMSYGDPLAEPEAPLKPDWSKKLVFDNVSFKYPGTERYVLKNVSFTIPPGSRVALIGGPGSGKSTILKLLLRLYDPTEGEIVINGCRFRDMLTPDVRKDVTLVEQEIFLFSGTIRENIAFSNPEATDEEIKEAARRAQAARFIEAAPKGYDTIIGERGVTLSGGQKQRIAIARALLAKPKLLLLDDSTSAVDIKTEARLRLAMEELIKGRTSIIVTQRPTTLVESDIIIFLDKGEVVDVGTHQELLTRCPQYQFMLSHLPRGAEILASGAPEKVKSSSTSGGMH